ncbi:MAG: hypothetical protein AAF563_17340 [Pseudomonadota bacterium]
MKRNLPWFIIGALVVVVAVLGYIIYENEQRSSGINIDVGGDNLSIETD